MTIIKFDVTDRKAWLAARKPNVNASEVGAVFNVHPYLSKLKLFHEKSGVEFKRDAMAETMLSWRLILEDAIPKAIAIERPEWKLEKCTQYVFDDKRRIGSTPDFWIHGDKRGLGILQAKTAAPGPFKSHWPDAPPFWVVLQNQTELMLHPEAVFGAVCCLVIDPWSCRCPVYEVPRHQAAIDRIKIEVASFWERVAQGVEPEFDPAKDGDLINTLFPAAVPLKEVDLRGDNELPGMLAERARIMRDQKKKDGRKKEIEATIKSKMEDAEIGMIPGWRVTFKNQHTAGYTVKPRDGRVLVVKELTPTELEDSDDE